MSGSRHIVGGSVQDTDGWRGTFLLVEIDCTSTVLGVRGGDDIGVAGSPNKDSAQEGSWQETALGDHASQRRAMHL